ncbi:MAG: ATP-binding cassette domain-containing protein [Clostridiales bacterium]|nr:ATP-binding cassette domain-containing protein [Clostridiales bacterium]
MAITVEIQKKLGDFRLDVAFSAGNEVLALLGGSGSGKSMTLRCIAGIETPDAGRIVVDGVTFFDAARRINLPPQKRHVGLLFQNYALFPNMTVEKNIMEGLPGVKNRQERQRWAAEMIQKFHLEGLEQYLPGQLSGGQQQRVALARILIGAPSILMLDEPFSALDTSLRWQLERELMGWLREFGGTTLFVSHSRDEVYRVSDRIAAYAQGRIAAIKSPRELFSDPQTYNVARLTGCKNFSAAVVEGAQVHAVEWGMSFEVPDCRAGNCVGIRAHDLRLARTPGVNTYPYVVLDRLEEPFQYVLRIRRADRPDAKPLEWIVERAAAGAIPQTGLVCFPPEALMVLDRPPEAGEQG